MDDTTTDCAAFGETAVFLSHFNDLPDPRQQGKVTYPLDEILLLCLLAVLAGAEAFTEIALFGVKKLGFLRRFRPFENGMAVTMNIGPPVLTNIGPPPPVSDLLSWAEARLSRSAARLCPPDHDLAAFRWAVVRRNR